MLKIKTFFRDEDGATAIEYGLIAAATGLALIAVMPALAAALAVVFNSLTAGMQSSV